MSIMEQHWISESRISDIPSLIWILEQAFIRRHFRFWDEERALNELRYFKKNDQIAFLTQEVIDDVVKFVESYEVRP